jgi:hypothetical protein
VNLKLGLSSSKENKLRVLSIGLIFRPKKENVTGDWRKLHNEELHNSPVLG